MPHGWPALLARDGDALFDHFRHTLEALGRHPGTLTLILGEAQRRFQRQATPTGALSAAA